MEVTTRAFVARGMDIVPFDHAAARIEVVRKENGVSMVTLRDQK